MENNLAREKKRATVPPVPKKGVFLFYTFSFYVIIVLCRNAQREYEIKKKVRRRRKNDRENH